MQSTEQVRKEEDWIWVYWVKEITLAQARSDNRKTAVEQGARTWAPNCLPLRQHQTEPQKNINPDPQERI
jgi:hypothetical protein